MSDGKDQGEPGKKPSALLFDERRLSVADRRPAEEFPLALTVNGVELATLIASPHDLMFLVAGFLRMQGFVRSADDLLSLSVCQDSGAAFVKIRGDVPGQLKPTLTSGCGSGITLVGYARGTRFTIYTHPWRIDAAFEEKKCTISGGNSLQKT